MTNLARFNHKMPLANRNILAISCSSILFGSISVPYCYIATRALSHFKPTVTLIVVPVLVICTLFLFLVFISRTTLEQRLANKLGAYSYPLFIVMVVLALGSCYFIESIIANFTLFLPVEYWFYLILISGIASAVAFVIVIVTRPSRLENFIASKLHPSNRSSLVP